MSFELEYDYVNTDNNENDLEIIDDNAKFRTVDINNDNIYIDINEKLQGTEVRVIEENISKKFDKLKEIIKNFKIIINTKKLYESIQSNIYQ